MLFHYLLTDQLICAAHETAHGGQRQGSSLRGLCGNLPNKGEANFMHPKVVT